MADFKIQIEQLSEAKRPFSFEASAAWWAAREVDSQSEACTVETPFRFVLEASRAAERVLIEGEVEGRVGLECSRCGKRYPHSLRDSYRLVLEPVNPADGSDPTEEPTDPEAVRSLAENGLCLGEDLEAGWYRGPLVRLEEFFGEVIALAMPIQPLCKETCLGICAHCGAERTDESGSGCGCEDEKIESPFAVLAKLKLKRDADA